MTKGLKKLVHLFAVVGLAWGGPAPLLAADPVKWSATWAEGACSARGSTPLGPEMLLSITPGNGISILSLTGKGLGRITARQVERLELLLQPSGPAPAMANYLSSRYPEGPSLSFVSEDRSFLEEVAGSTSILVRNGKKTLFEIASPDAAAAVVALRECEREGLRLHGIDPESWRALRSVPRLTVPLFRLVRAQDYPESAAASGLSGTVIVRLSVDRSGKPVKCDFIARSGTESLDQVTCEIFMERARFDPAIDRAGMPTAAPFVAKLSWRTG